jgi:glutathionyl-hydroquinone reductase
MIKSHLDASIEETQKNATKRHASGEFAHGISGFRHAIGEVLSDK